MDIFCLHRLNNRKEKFILILTLNLNLCRFHWRNNWKAKFILFVISILNCFWLFRFNNWINKENFIKMYVIIFNFVCHWLYYWVTFNFKVIICSVFNETWSLSLNKGLVKNCFFCKHLNILCKASFNTWHFKLHWLRIQFDYLREWIWNRALCLKIGDLIFNHHILPLRNRHFLLNLLTIGFNFIAFWTALTK